MIASGILVLHRVCVIAVDEPFAQISSMLRPRGVTTNMYLGSCTNSHVASMCNFNEGQDLAEAGSVGRK